VLAITMDEVFTRENIANCALFSDGIKRISGVAEALSVVDVPYARSTEGGASLEKLIPPAKCRTSGCKRRVQLPRATGCLLETWSLRIGRTAAFNILLEPRFADNRATPDNEGNL